MTTKTIEYLDFTVEADEQTEVVINNYEEHIAELKVQVKQLKAFGEEQVKINNKQFQEMQKLKEKNNKMKAKILKIKEFVDSINQ